MMSKKMYNSYKLLKYSDISHSDIYYNNLEDKKRRVINELKASREKYKANMCNKELLWRWNIFAHPELQKWIYNMYYIIDKMDNLIKKHNNFRLYIWYFVIKRKNFWGTFNKYCYILDDILNKITNIGILDER